MLTLSEIEAAVQPLARKIGAPANLLPTYGGSEQTARPHVEVDAGGYAYVVAERGREIRRDAGLDLDELLYRIFADVTFELAVQYELAHRSSLRDSRRLHFKRQVELMALLSPAWGRREAQAHEEILKRYPFEDGAGGDA